MELFDLGGRVAVVTGGNGGIGLGMARGLAQAGAAIVAVGRNRAKSAAAVAELKDLGVEAIAVEADVAQPDAGGRFAGRRSTGSAGSTFWSTTPAPTSASRRRTTPSRSGKPSCKPT